MALDGKRVGFLGAGAMASAMMKGLIAAGVDPARLSCSDPWDVARAKAEEAGITTGSNADVARTSHVIVVAVKPGARRRVSSLGGRREE